MRLGFGMSQISSYFVGFKFIELLKKIKTSLCYILVCVCVCFFLPYFQQKQLIIIIIAHN